MDNMNNHMKIRIEDLNLDIGRSRILKDINVEIPKHKITVILGPSGCGKTTLLKSGYTIVLVTHILRQAIRLADYVIFMYLGEVIEQGPAEQFFKSPRTEITKAYLKGSIN